MVLNLKTTVTTHPRCVLCFWSWAVLYPPFQEGPLELSLCFYLLNFRESAHPKNNNNKHPETQTGYFSSHKDRKWDATGTYISLASVMRRSFSVWEEVQLPHPQWVVNVEMVIFYVEIIMQFFITCFSDFIQLFGINQTRIVIGGNQNYNRLCSSLYSLHCIHLFLYCAEWG